MNPQPNQSASDALVEIDKPIYGGAFLARIEGKAVFVPMSLPGEQVRIRITGEKRGYASAEVDEIVVAAPERIAPGCRHFGVCGGCAYQHANYDSQLAFKRAILRETLERAGVRAPDEIAVLAAEPWRYRNRIRVGFDEQGNPGYRGRRSHAIVPITECPIAAPLLVDAALACAEVARQVPSAPRINEISLFCNAAESALLATILAAGSGRGKFEALAAALAERIPALAGIELALEAEEGLPSRILARWGASSISYPAGGFEYRVDPGAFFQVNRWLADALIDCVTQSHSGAIAWDLFSGVGLFARRLTAGFERVLAVESAPQATAAVAHNLSGTSATAVNADTLAFLRKNIRGPRPDLIVADPPRNGLGADICNSLAEIAAPAMVYVSCDPATLARDLRALTASYEIQSITLADLFPQTLHLETIVRLRHLSGWA
jgi:23S rRNA (uracil1939-C5)-methyltransferase